MPLVRNILLHKARTEFASRGNEMPEWEAKVVFTESELKELLSLGKIQLDRGLYRWVDQE